MALPQAASPDLTRSSDARAPALARRQPSAPRRLGRLRGAFLAALAFGALGARAQDAPAPNPAASPATSPASRPEASPAPRPLVVSPPAAEAADTTLSPECRVPGSQLYALAKLAAVQAALAEKRPVRVLAIGGTSAGLGASATYPEKLATALKRALGADEVEVEARGLQGEIASGAAERLRSMVAEVEPDLVIWQVGTHDALARIELDTFSEALDDTVQWIKSHGIDVVLVDPLYTASLANDAYYTSVVQAVRTVALREKVPLVQRYEAMRYLSTRFEKEESHMLGRHFRLNDLGLRCMAEHVTRAISLSLLQADGASPKPEPGKGGAPGADGPTAEGPARR